MNRWDQFDRSLNQSIVNEANVISSTSSDFEELPLGAYEVSIDSLKLGQSKAGDPMVSTTFKVVAGNYEGRLIFKHAVIYKGDDKDKYRLGNELKFLKSLGTNHTVSFEGFGKLEQLINAIFEEITKAKFEYLVEISEKNNFRFYKIKEIYEPEQEPQLTEDNLPF